MTNPQKEEIIKTATDQYSELLKSHQQQIDGVRATILGVLTNSFVADNQEDDAIFQFESQTQHALNYAVALALLSFGFSLRQLMSQVTLK